MTNRYLLVLVSLNPDGTDVGGSSYPNSGHVEALDYHSDLNIMHGLCGTIAGKVTNSRWFNTDPQGQWRVVKVEQTEDVITLDPRESLIKFPSGMVVFSGDRAGCDNYIASSSGLDKQLTNLGFEVQDRGHSEEVQADKAENLAS